MSDHPYKSIAPDQSWRKVVSGIPSFKLDPMRTAAFSISKEDVIVTAGSCFAQHISKRLTGLGFSFLVAERAPEEMSSAQATEHQYGIYTARYGNIYTSLQLLQLFDRAFDKFDPELPVWRNEAGAIVDPFRPTIEPSGFPDEAAMLQARRRHLSCVKQSFEQADIFVFTLGLTEGWSHKSSGAVIPLAPGVAGGQWLPHEYSFFNETVSDTVRNLSTFIAKLREINQGCKFILTVSPVPLAATYEKRHVLQSTIYSKSVLRVAAEEVASKTPNVIYFPSFEIVTSPSNRRGYFEDDLRSVSREGVDHVMRVFLSHFVGAKRIQVDTAELVREQVADISSIICDEERLSS